jgi:type I restriction enzyme R subunit
MELGDEVLKRIAQELVEVVRSNATVDWDKKEQVRASLRRHIRRLADQVPLPARQAGVGRPARDATGRDCSPDEITG